MLSENFEMYDLKILKDKPNFHSIKWLKKHKKIVENSCIDKIKEINIVFIDIQLHLVMEKNFRLKNLNKDAKSIEKEF